MNPTTSTDEFKRGDLFTNDDERLVIVSNDGQRVKYRKEHKRPKRDANGQALQTKEVYTQDYSCGLDRAELWKERGFWKPIN